MSVQRVLLASVLCLIAGSASAVEIIHVPGDVGDLQSAIASISNGGIIEMAGGTYVPPGAGFTANNLGKAFTVRAAAGATVILDGQNTRQVFSIVFNRPKKNRTWSR